MKKAVYGLVLLYYEKTPETDEDTAEWVRSLGLTSQGESILRERLLSIGRLEAGEVIFRSEETDLAELCQDAAVSSAGDKAYEISCTPEEASFIWQGSGSWTKEALPYIFDRFYRPKDSRKGHVGLGLNLSRLIIEGQKGHLCADNAEDGGAQFTILLPRFEALK